MMEFSDCESILTEDFASKFTEFMAEEPKSMNEKSKNVSMNSIPSKIQYNHHSDLESLATEVFEDYFHNFLTNNHKTDLQSLTNRSNAVESSNNSIIVDMGNICNVQPMRRDIMNKFLAKYALDENQIINELNDGERKSNFTNTNHIKENGKRLQFKDFDKSKDDQRKNKDSITKHDLATEIRSKSLKIQNEIHEERRRKKLDSIEENAITDEQTPRERLDQKVKELDLLTGRMRQARSEREKITAELDFLRNKLKTRPDEVSKESKWYGESKSGMDINYINNTVATNQIHNTENQLRDLNFQLNLKKSQLKNLESRIRQRLKEIEDLEFIGLSKQEIEQVIEERNDLYEILRQSEENGNDRYELEKRLSEAKEDLSIEHKRSQDKIIYLERELDSCFKKLHEMSDEKDELFHELTISKEGLQRQQDDMNELYQERNDLRYQVDKYKEEIESERLLSKQIISQEKKRLESHLISEETQMKLKISELKNEISALSIENKSIIDKNCSFKLKLSQIENENQKLKLTFDHQENEHRENLQTINEERNQAIEKLKKEFYNSKLNEIQNLKTEFDSEQMRTINNLKECYKQQVDDLQLRIENKSQEIQDLRGEIRKFKQKSIEKEENLKSQYETEISHLKDEIRRNVDSIEEKRIKHVEELRTKYEILISKLKKEIDEERLMNERLRHAFDKANKDLAHENEVIKKYKHEKNASINRIKELAKEKLQEEYKSLKRFYEKELEDQLKIVEKTMQEKNGQIISNCKEIRQLKAENKERNQSLETSLNDFIDILRNQCSKMASEAKFTSAQWKNIKINENDDLSVVLQLTIKNLQNCFQEYNQYHHQFSEKFQREQEQSLKILEDNNLKNIEVVRQQILKDHAKELNSINVFHKHELNEMKMKHNVEIEDIRLGVKVWKSKTAERIAQKLQKEFAKEIDRKSSKSNTKLSSSLSLCSFKNDTAITHPKPIGLIEELRGNIRQLRDENMSLRRVIIGKASGVLEPIDNQHYSLQSSASIPNGNNFSSSTSNRPQSACPDNRNRHHSKEISIQRSSSFKNY